MSFIGNVPAESYSPVVKDTFSGNGSTTDFTLSIPATTNSVEVLVENVQQEPTSAYTIAGTTLSFTAAPTSGTNNIYVIHRGPAVQQVVPPAGVALSPSTVTATGDISTEGDLKVEVASGGIYTITGTDTSSNRTLTLPDEAGTVLTSASALLTPNFCVESGSQSISAATATKVQFGTEIWDTAGAFDSSTNYRFTVPSGQGGNYLLYARLHIDNVTDQNYGEIHWYINGSNLEKNRARSSQSLTQQWVRFDSQLGVSLSAGDYVEVYGYASGGGSLAFNFGQFFGYKLG